MALIRRNLVVSKITSFAVQKNIANGNGILLALVVRPWPFTLVSSTGLAINTTIKMFAKDGGGIEVLGTKEPKDVISMDLDRGYSFIHTDRNELTSAMEVVRFLDSSSGNTSLGVFTGGLTLTLTGDTANPHNIEAQVEVLEFD